MVQDQQELQRPVRIGLVFCLMGVQDYKVVSLGLLYFLQVVAVAVDTILKAPLVMVVQAAEAEAEEITMPVPVGLGGILGHLERKVLQ